MNSNLSKSKSTTLRGWRWIGRGLVAVAVSSTFAGPLAAQRQVTDTACAKFREFLGPRATGAQREQARECINAVDRSRRMQAFRLAMPAVRYLGELPWRIPEYHDEQRLSDGANGFGPMAFIYASPALGSFTSPAQFAEHGDRGVLVGVVSVLQTDQGETLPHTYTNLGLGWGLNCIYLTYRPSGPEATRWRGYVTNSGTTGTTPCAPSNTPAWLPVLATRQPPYGLKDTPPVARFSDATNGKPLLGVACLDAWCEIGPDAANATPTPGLGGPQMRIKGWHDEQVLSVGGLGIPLRPSIRAKIVPRVDIDRLTLADFADWVEVADILLTQDPPTTTKYYRWGLRRGKNVLELRLVSGNWEAQVTVRVQGQLVTRAWMFPEPRHPHVDAAVPGTARFRWTAADEGVWVPCGQGCCKVEGIAQ